MEVLGTYDPTPRIPLPRPDDDPLLIPPAAQLQAADGTPQARPMKTKQKRYKDLQLDTIRTKYWLGVGGAAE